MIVGISHRECLLSLTPYNPLCAAYGRRQRGFQRGVTVDIACWTVSLVVYSMDASLDAMLDIMIFRGAVGVYILDGNLDTSPEALLSVKYETS